MLSPTLVLGVGGSGGKTVRAAKQSIEKSLSEAGYPKGIPSCWQFLHIDTTYVQEGDEFPAPFLPSDEFYSIVPVGINFQDIQKSIVSKHTTDELRDWLAGWAEPLIDTPLIGTSSHRSRRIKRADGRLVGIPFFSGTFRKIEKSISILQSPQSGEELKNLAGILQDDNTASELQIILISSLSGATGSGMFLDLGEILKRSTPYSFDPISFLYTQDIFKELSSTSSACNSLGALNELINSCSHGLSEQSLTLYQEFGIFAEYSEYGFGCSTNILVNARNISNFEENLGCDEIVFKFGNYLGQSLFRGNLNNLADNQIAFLETENMFIQDDPGLTSRSDKMVMARFMEKNIFNTPPYWRNRPLVTSILKSHQRSVTSLQSWEYFWDGGRSRPLVEAVPFGAELRETIVIGWFIARLFDLCQISQDEMGFQVSIWNISPNQSGWNFFAYPLPPLSKEDAAHAWVLPAILKSAGLALCQYGATGNVEVISAYRFLLFLGREVFETMLPEASWKLPQKEDKFSSLSISGSTHLKDWIKEGKKFSDREVPQLGNESSSTPEARKQVLLQKVSKIQQNYTTAWDQLSELSWSEMPETWELRSDIDLALSLIFDFCVRVSQQE